MILKVMTVMKKKLFLSIRFEARVLIWRYMFQLINTYHFKTLSKFVSCQISVTHTRQGINTVHMFQVSSFKGMKI